MHIADFLMLSLSNDFFFFFSGNLSSKVSTVNLKKNAEYFLTIFTSTIKSIISPSLTRIPFFYYFFYLYHYLFTIIIAHFFFFSFIECILELFAFQERCTLTKFSITVFFFFFKNVQFLIYYI